MYQFRLPDIGEGVVEAEVVKWQVAEGELVTADQPIVEVMTDKASVEISSPRGGRVHRLCGREGDTIAVGETLIEIDDEITLTSSSDNAPKEADGGDSRVTSVTLTPTRSQTPRQHQPPRMPERPHLRVEATSERQSRAEAVPAVRELAKQLGVDIQQIVGSGPDGRVMRHDVEAFSEAVENGTPQLYASAAMETEDEPDWNRQPLRGMRRLIAERMARSARSIPHFSFVEEVDVTELEKCRKQLAERGQEVSPLSFVAAVVVRVLPDYPQINASVDEDREEVIYKGRVHLGIAVATGEGLMVPVIRNAEDRSATELAASIADLSERARAKGLRPAELKGSTFTITSMGKLGGLMGTPIINHPEAAIMAVHAIRTLPRYIDGELQPRHVFNLSVSLDHRIVDGFECAQFMQDVKEVLQLADFPEFK